MLLVEKFFSLSKQLFSYTCVSALCCAQEIFNVIYYLVQHLNLPSANKRVAKFLLKIVWRPRGKNHSQIITFKKQTLDPHLWSIFAFKGAPILIQKMVRLHPKKRAKMSLIFSIKNSLQSHKFYLPF